MKHLYLITLTSLASCASMKDSLQLGAGVGAFTGAAATYSAHQSMGRSAKLEDVAVGAGVGLGIGLLTSYLVHKSLADEPRPYSENETPQMHFGDLPPSPFIMPPIAPRRKK